MAEIAESIEKLIKNENLQNFDFYLSIDPANSINLENDFSAIAIFLKKKDERND